MTELIPQVKKCLNPLYSRPLSSVYRPLPSAPPICHCEEAKGRRGSLNPYPLETRLFVYWQRSDPLISINIQYALYNLQSSPPHVIPSKAEGSTEQLRRPVRRSFSEGGSGFLNSKLAQSQTPIHRDHHYNPKNRQKMNKLTEIHSQLKL